jgi:predicted naringenin-chalcone synthase
MGTIRSTAVAVPSLVYSQAEVLAAARRWLGERMPRFERILQAFERGLVGTRASAIPLEEVFERRSFEEKNGAYMRAAAELGERAVRACLDRAGCRPRDVDFFISASCTGFMIPSLDAVLAHKLAMKASLARLPITQHGCAGGAVALRQAWEHLQVHPDHVVLVLAAEVPSVTFQPDDFSPENVVSTSLFGDGAAAVLLTAEGDPGAPRIVASDSTMFPSSLDLMGFNLTNAGLKVVLSKRVPEEIRAHAPEALAGFLARQGLDLGDVRHFLLHPGGRKIIEGFEAALQLGAGALEVTRDVLARHGNLSSATVLFILDEVLRRGEAARGDLGLLVAFGPGFGCESLLLQWGVPAMPRAAPRPHARVSA